MFSVSYVFPQTNHKIYKWVFCLSIMSVIFLAMGATLSTMLQAWQNVGVFEFLLPFMLIFAIVFGILSQAKFLGENRAVNATIALAIGLFAILFPQTRLFFANISANMAIGVVVLLAALIMLGLFVDWEKDKGWRNGMAAFGGVIALVVILVSLSSNGFLGGFWWWDMYWPHIVVGLVVVGAIIAIIATSNKAKTP